MVIHGPKGWSPQQTTPRRLHRHQAAAITKSFKAMVIDHHLHQNARPSSPPGSFTSVHSSLRSSSSSAHTERTPPKHHESLDSNDSWEVVDDLPLRWATDYVNLANPGSKLASSQVLFYETWKNGGIDGRGTSMLAIATKTNILLYETPKGERAFRFVKVRVYLTVDVQIPKNKYRNFILHCLRNPLASFTKTPQKFQGQTLTPRD